MARGKNSHFLGTSGAPYQSILRVTLQLRADLSWKCNDVQSTAFHMFLVKTHRFNERAEVRQECKGLKWRTDVEAVGKSTADGVIYRRWKPNK